ncbi:hypothetical protein HY732_02165 [Candidatus Uhrbacteria bacterium]|nr:hypothetical protein [Candidatus Uhrbacteria bacterium]
MIQRTIPHTITAAYAIIFFLVVIFGGAGRAAIVRADESVDDVVADEPCPELKRLKSESATIGGNAWNTMLGWIYHQWPADDTSSPFRVQKLPEKNEPPQSGAEIYGWSSYSRLVCAAERKRGTPNNCPSICWGKTCGKRDSDQYGWNNGSENFCTNPDGQTCMRPPWDDYPLDRDAYPQQVAKGAYAELDYDHPERVYEALLPDEEKKIMTAEEVMAQHIPKNKRTLKYCRYPVNGWLKIRQLKEDGWVKLGGRIYSASVPVPVPGREPGAEYVNWPERKNCILHPEENVCHYQVMYDPWQKEFVGWAWSPRVRWISFSGSTSYAFRSLWQNPNICGAKCTEISYDTTAKRSKWNSSFTGVWVQTLGGNIFAKKGFAGVAPPPGEVNTPYIIITGRYTQGGETKRGVIAPWEGECDNPDNSTCSRVGREQFDPRARAPSEERRGALADLSFPRASQNANRSFIKRSMLGTVDTSGFMPASDAFVPQKNAKGNLVRRIADEAAIWSAATSSANGLGAVIYYHDGDLVLGEDDADKKIIYSSMNGVPGAGTVVVRGNLIIKRPFEYSSLAVKDIRQLASISWIVLERVTPAVALPPGKPADISDDDWKAGGNISIDDCLASSSTPTQNDVAQGKQLARIAGTFFAEHAFATGTGHGGQGAGECSALGVSFETTHTIRPDRGDTCTGTQSEQPDGSASCTVLQTNYYDVPLEIEGIVVARNMMFQRVYRGRNRGSEIIVNTGRMLVNPPPGLAEFSKSLPLW